MSRLMRYLYRTVVPQHHHVNFPRSFVNAASLQEKARPPRYILPDSEVHHVFLLGSGPGGQKINKTASAVQITHLPTGIVVKNQQTRSRDQNYKIARRILADKVELLQKGDDSKVAKDRSRAEKKKARKDRKSKKKYIILDEEKRQRVAKEQLVESQESRALDPKIELEENAVNKVLSKFGI